MQKKWLVAIAVLAAFGLIAGWAFAMLVRTPVDLPRQSAIVVTPTAGATPVVPRDPTPSGAPTTSTPPAVTPTQSPSPKPTSASPTAPETVRPAQPHSLDDDDDDDDDDNDEIDDDD